MLNIAYISIFVLIALLLHIALRKTLNLSASNKPNRVSFYYFLGIATWIVYLHFISTDGFLYDKSYPPRFPIFVFLPILFFILIFLYSIRHRNVFKNIPPEWPIYFQSFRVLMELIILMTFTAGILPVQATFLGYNYEILFALTAPIIAYFTFTKPTIPEHIALAWNIIGILFLIVVVSIIVSSFFLPELWNSQEELVDIRFTQLPLLLLPAFIVPSAIIVHLFSIMQILKRRFNVNIDDHKKAK